MTETSYCQVCHYEAKANTVEQLRRIWFKHIDKESHLQNVMMYIMLDIGANSIEEIDEKLDEFIANGGRK